MSVVEDRLAEIGQQLDALGIVGRQQSSGALQKVGCRVTVAARQGAEGDPAFAHLQTGAAGGGAGAFE